MSKKTYGRVAVFAGTMVAGGLGLTGTAHAFVICPQTISQTGAGATATSTGSCDGVSTASADGEKSIASSTNASSVGAVATAVADGALTRAKAKNDTAPGATAIAKASGDFAKATATNSGGLSIVSSVLIRAEALTPLAPAPAGTALATAGARSTAAASTTGGGTAVADALRGGTATAQAVNGGRAKATSHGTGTATAIALGDCTVRAHAKGRRDVVRLCVGSGGIPVVFPPIGIFPPVEILPPILLPVLPVITPIVTAL